ncbi:HAD-IA family hydrolase [Streptomyces millisiae]|uniref:HAD-IA family hydrolase n=1 Tax=Streptomyces millisiae TaxID=3075542 RepID=A0ABU2LN63_9ACTN|nr:HAD-IA family hydrolase [Streptomyces sp. DSM 44918]MDT0318672.1 HAD-IA family hydrolase [Streptomyces sp. DSM 44918]
MTVPPFEAVLCDIDGVLRHWPSLDAIERANGLPVGAMAAVALTGPLAEAAITGRTTDEQWRAAVVAELAAAHGSPERAAAAVAAWSAVLPRVDDEVVALLTGLRGVIPVALVSNATTRLEADLARLGLAEIADAVVNTSALGFAKPDPRVYATAAERVGVPPARCLFVDDTEANVLAAREAGMTGLHFRTAADLRGALRLTGAG